MEFKAIKKSKTSTAPNNINRIKVEFKVFSDNMLFSAKVILIESKWNLKLLVTCPLVLQARHINRIKVEFKELQCLGTLQFFLILIESKWNLKLSRLKVYISNFAY